MGELANFWYAYGKITPFEKLIAAACDQTRAVFKDGLRDSDLSSLNWARFRLLAGEAFGDSAASEKAALALRQKNLLSALLKHAAATETHTDRPTCQDTVRRTPSPTPSADSYGPDSDVSADGFFGRTPPSAPIAAA